MTQEEARQIDARGRILHAAGEVFAEAGYRGATVRDICRRAGANVAAVNYHFGGKDKLYEAVCRYSMEMAVSRYSPTLGLQKKATPQERLRLFIRASLLNMLGRGRPSWLEMLIVREMTLPTKVLDSMVAKSIRPNQRMLFDIIRDYLGDGAPEETVRLCLWSIIGQCLYYRTANSVIRRLSPQTAFDDDGIEKIAAHVYRFSLNALKQIRRESKGVATCT